MNSTAKSAKQSNLADWVSSATKPSASKPIVNGQQIQNLVGQKRTDISRLDRDKSIVLPAKKQKESETANGVSEFNMKDEM
jgi:hypothetical protein